MNSKDRYGTKRTTSGIEIEGTQRQKSKNREGRFIHLSPVTLLLALSACQWFSRGDGYSLHLSGGAMQTGNRYVAALALEREGDSLRGRYTVYRNGDTLLRYFTSRLAYNPVLREYSGGGTTSHTWSESLVTTRPGIISFLLASQRFDTVSISDIWRLETGLFQIVAIDAVK